MANKRTMERIEDPKRAPLFDPATFGGRWRHFAAISNPLLNFVPAAELAAAKGLLDEYEKGSEPAGTSVAQIRRAQTLYQSAFHPDTGDLQNAVGRMSFQVPGGTTLIGAMMIFYRSNGAVIFWQWANQSFNALVNYTNRNAASALTNAQIGTAYASATSAALVVSLGLKRSLAGRGGLATKLVPLAATLSANCVNITLMRQSELTGGIRLKDEQGQLVTESKVAAQKAVSLVTISRCAIVTPPMLIVPMLMQRIEKAAWFQRHAKVANIACQVGLSAAMLTVMVPTGCALFPQNSCVEGAMLEKREPAAFAKILEARNGHLEQARQDRFYFNKGL